MAKSTLFKNGQPPRSSLAPGRNGIVEVQIINLGTHLRMFLHDTPENWSFQVHFSACAHNSQPLSLLEVSPYEVFSYATDFSADFLISSLSIFFYESTAQYCSALHILSHYQQTDFIPLFQNTMLKIFATWFHAIEKLMPKRTDKKYIFFFAPKMPDTPILDNPMPIYSFKNCRNFEALHLADKQKPLRQVHFKIVNKHTDIKNKFLTQGGKLFPTQ